MSDEKIEYCPWCGGSASHGLVQRANHSFGAVECGECATVFRVEVPHEEKVLKWSDAR